MADSGCGGGEFANEMLEVAIKGDDFGDGANSGDVMEAAAVVCGDKSAARTETDGGCAGWAEGRVMTAPCGDDGACGMGDDGDDDDADEDEEDDDTEDDDDDDDGDSSL